VSTVDGATKRTTRPSSQQDRDLRAIDSSAAPSRIAQVLYRVRCLLGRVFGWDRVRMRPEESLVSRLSARDRAESEVMPGTHRDSFSVLYQFADEALSEIRNATVHGYLCLALVPMASGTDSGSRGRTCC
jgi:hypothetical protein